MKLENNWQYKTIESLEKIEWPHFDGDSRLIRRTKELRKIPLNAFTTEDLRTMIGERIGLDYLIPLALQILNTELFAEGDFFPGDLLKNVLAIDTVFWTDNRDHWLTLYNLINHRRNEIAKEKFSTADFDKANTKVLGKQALTN
ncbi:MAG TPA: contact-dependent growth inhibition system immunity protein [Mucilaginibacter sp.]|jgi:hypothetical protein